MQKQVFNILVLALFFIAGLPTMTIAQDGDKSFEKDFDWKAANETKTFYVNVQKGSDRLKMNFSGRISEGAFMMNAYDPEGNKVGGFSLVCSGADGTHVHVNVTDGEVGHTHVHEGHGENGTNININTNGSNTTTVTTTTTTTTSDDDDEYHVKAKSKKKRKKKGKNKNYQYSTTSSDGSSKESKGVMKKTFSEPMPGKWKFVLEAKEVTGKVTADVRQE